MRRSFLVVMLAVVASSASAQTFSEALTYSQNNYSGTARSMALGNAMTALGGDLGSIGINPAGSAVAPYSQFTITPGVSLSSSASSYSSWVEDFGNQSLGAKQNKGYLPNFGFTLTFDTYRKHGLKSHSFGIVSNTTSVYNSLFNAGGINQKTSMLGSFAAGAAPYRPAELNNPGNFFGSYIPWNYLVAYQSGMIADAYDEFGKPMVDADGNYTYLGTTEGMYPNADGTYDIRTMGDLNQFSRVSKGGSKQDLLINYGMNFDDRFFLGFNLGMPLGSYLYDEYFRESAVDPQDFSIEYSDGNVANFSHAVYQYSQNTQYSGIYAKVGFIWLADGGLRLGAAIQTPTLITINDRWSVSGSTSFTNSSYNASAQPSSPSEYTYDLRLPYRFNAGVAYTFWDKGLVSFDFEMADYSTMKFSETDGGYTTSDYFAVENEVNRNFGGMGFQGRLGGEVRISPALTFRAGYIYQTSGEYFRRDNVGDLYDAATYLAFRDDFVSGRRTLTGWKPFDNLVQSISCGFGYSSPGSFFADVAFRGTALPATAFNPYSDYISSGDYLPQVDTKWKNFDLVMTLGWRF